MEMEWVELMNQQIWASYVCHVSEPLRFVNLLCRKYNVNELLNYCTAHNMLHRHCRYKKPELAEMILQMLIDQPFVANRSHMSPAHCRNLIKVVYQIDNGFSNFECNICLEQRSSNNAALLQCGHVFCGLCLSECIKSNKKDCAMCRANIKRVEVADIVLHENLSRLAN